MAGFFSKCFPFLFPDPAKVAMERKIRINGALRRFDQEVKKQDNFIKQYLQQATNAKRTGDGANYNQVKKALARTFVFRKRAQRALNFLRLASTMSDQMEAYRDFCGAMQDIGKMMSTTFSFDDATMAQAEFEKGMMNAKNAEEMMDHMLDNFESSWNDIASSDLESAGLQGDSLDKMIDQMADSKDSLTEEVITQVLNGVKKVL
ncbi:MAG: hypothetical protein IKR48_06265 [Kiritimatiellae bacterium]|nr:hypothetical protein [Kiritimatiellia bacterium]